MKKSSLYGKLPADLGLVDLNVPEVMYYLYLPISLAGQNRTKVPVPLREPLQPLLLKIMCDIGPKAWRDNNIYVTVKKMFCSPSITANRPGWHGDGFGTDDLNYVWYDCLPTLFNPGPFLITEGDHTRSLQEFEEQVVPERNIVYPCKHLLKLDQYVIHAVAPATEQMMRTFIKVSVSKDRYNLKDNSINHELDYNWEQYDRNMVRNDPIYAGRDSYRPSTPEDDHFK